MAMSLQKGTEMDEFGDQQPFSAIPEYPSDNKSDKHLSMPPSELGPPKSDRPPLSGARELLFVLTIVGAQLLTQAGLGQALAPLHTIGDHFNEKNPGDLSWYVAAYSLTTGTFILIAGRLGDMFGHKRIFVGAWVWFAIWSFVCGACYYSTSIFFSAARGIQGMGPAFLTPNGLALLGMTYPNGMRKNLVFAFFGACAPGGYILGATFSSMLAHYTNWSWAYFIMGIVCFLMGAASVFTVPDVSKILSSKEKAHFIGQKFDFLGAITGVTGLVLINVAWNQAPSVGWPTPYVYILLILGILSLVAFGFIEARVEAPLVPVKSLSAPVLFVLSATASGWASFGIWLYYIWQFLQLLRGDTALSVSAQISPSALTGFMASLFTGFLISKIPIPYIMILAMLAFILAPILSATMPINQTYWAQTFITQLIIPFGMDMSFPSAIIILSASVPKEHQGIAASLVLTVTNYSISLGLGIAGTVVQQIDPSGKNLLHEFRSGWYTSIGLAGLGIAIAVASALYMRRYPLALPPH